MAEGIMGGQNVNFASKFF